MTCTGEPEEYAWENLKIEGMDVIYIMDLSKKELDMLIYVTDSQIKRWRNMGEDVGNHWDILLKKLEERKSELKGQSK